MAYGGNSSDSGASEEHMSDVKPESEPEPETESESESESESEPELQIQNLDQEPEWGVDSYDGREYLPSPEDHERFSTYDEYEEYCAGRRKAIASKGFEEDVYNGVLSIQINEYPQPYLVSLCVEKHNRVNRKTVECVRIVRATRRGGLVATFYITFMAREYPNGDLVEYQAKAAKYYKDSKPPVPIFCRPTPR